MMNDWEWAQRDGNEGTSGLIKFNKNKLMWFVLYDL